MLKQIDLEAEFVGDNGFRTISSMKRCHKPIIEAVCQTLDRLAAKVEHRRLTVVDLGCGNGALLRSLARVVGVQFSFIGIECCPEKVARGAKLSSLKSLDLIEGDLWAPSDSWTDPNDFVLAILMVGYLLDGPNTALKAWLTRGVDMLIAYAYEDDLERFSESINAFTQYDHKFYDEGRAHKRSTFVQEVTSLDCKPIGRRSLSI